MQSRAVNLRLIGSGCLGLVSGFLQAIVVNLMSAFAGFCVTWALTMVTILIFRSSAPGNAILYVVLYGPGLLGLSGGSILLIWDKRRRGTSAEMLGVLLGTTLMFCVWCWFGTAVYTSAIGHYEEERGLQAEHMLPRYTQPPAPGHPGVGRQAGPP